MDSYVTNRDVVANEKYGAWVESYFTYSGSNSFQASASEGTGTDTGSTSESNNGNTSGYTSHNMTKFEYSSHTDGNQFYSTASAGEGDGGNTADPAQNIYYTVSQFDTKDIVDDNGDIVSETYTGYTKRTYVSFDTISAYQSNEVIVSNGNFNFQYWSTSTGSDSTKTAWTNKTQTKTSTTTTYWSIVNSFLPRSTSSSTRTISLSQNYSYNKTSQDDFENPEDYTYKSTGHVFGGSNYLRDTIVFNNASIGGSSFLNGGAAYTLSAAVGLNTTVTGKFTDLFGLQTAPMFTFQDNQVFLSSERTDLVLAVFVGKSTRVLSGVTYTDNVINSTTMSGDTSLYTLEYTTSYNITGVGTSFETYPAVGPTPSTGYTRYTYTSQEWGYSYPTNNGVPYYTSSVATVSWGFNFKGTNSKYFYQTKTYTSVTSVAVYSSTTRTHLVSSYKSAMSLGLPSYTFVGYILSTSTSTYSPIISSFQETITPANLLSQYATASTGSAGSGGGGLTQGETRTHKSKFRMEAVSLNNNPPFYECEIVYSCPAIGYAGAGNSYSVSYNPNIVVALSAVISMVAGETFNSQDVLATVHLPTAEILEHVTYFPDSIPSSWTIKPQNAALISYLSSVNSMGSPASIKVWWTATTSTTTTFPSYKVFKGTTSASKQTTASRYTVKKATYVLSTAGSIGGNFLTSKTISLYGNLNDEFSTGYVDIRKEYMPSNVSIKFPAGCVDLTYQETGTSGAINGGTFSTSGSNEFVSFIVTDLRPFNVLAQPIYSFVRSYMGTAMNDDHIVSTLKYIPPASY